MDEAKPFKQRPDIGSRVTREGHARFWERPEVKFLRATRQTERDRPRRSTAGQPPTTEVFTDRPIQPTSATTAPRALCSTTSTINGTFPDPLHGSQANIAPSPPGRMGPRPTGSALGRGAGPSRHGGLWRWCIAWVTDRGVDAIETAGTGPLVAISGYHSWWREERQDTGATT